MLLRAPQRPGHPHRDQPTVMSAAQRGAGVTLPLCIRAWNTWFPWLGRPPVRGSPLPEPSELQHIFSHSHPHNQQGRLGLPCDASWGNRGSAPGQQPQGLCSVQLPFFSVGGLATSLWPRNTPVVLCPLRSGPELARGPPQLRTSAGPLPAGTKTRRECALVAVALHHLPRRPGGPCCCLALRRHILGRPVGMQGGEGLRDARRMAGALGTHLSESLCHRETRRCTLAVNECAAGGGWPPWRTVWRPLLKLDAGLHHMIQQFRSRVRTQSDGKMCTNRNLHMRVHSSTTQHSCELRVVRVSIHR